MDDFDEDNLDSEIDDVIISTDSERFIDLVNSCVEPAKIIETYHLNKAGLSNEIIQFEMKVSKEPISLEGPRR
jgi:hypothetical protein